MVVMEVVWLSMVVTLLVGASLVAVEVGQPAAPN